jgi:hypothetical protein
MVAPYSRHNAHYRKPTGLKATIFSILESYPVKARHLIISSSEEIKRILKPDINLIVWKRSLPNDLIDFAKLILEDSSYDLMDLASKDLPEHPGKNLFLEDIKFLEKTFRKLTGATKCQVGLSRVNSVQCPLFHVDFVSLRLFTTYIGLGTEYVTEKDCNRAHLGCGRNDHLVPDSSKIRRAKSGDVCFFKGDLFPGNQGFGVIHRSPIPDSPRLVLRMDCV